MGGLSQETTQWRLSPVSQAGLRDAVCQREACIFVEGKVDCGEYVDEDSVRQLARASTAGNILLSDQLRERNSIEWVPL